MTTLSRDHVVVRLGEPWRTSLCHSVGRLPEYRERGICTRTRRAHIEGMHCQAQCRDRDQRGSMFSSLSTASSDMAAPLDSQVLARRSARHAVPTMVRSNQKEKR